MADANMSTAAAWVYLLVACTLESHLKDKAVVVQGGIYSMTLVRVDLVSG